MKKLERSEMKNLKGGLLAPPIGGGGDATCTFIMTGSNGPGYCDYAIYCNTSNYSGPPTQDWCMATCFPDCNTHGCHHTHTWGQQA